MAFTATIKKFTSNSSDKRKLRLILEFAPEAKEIAVLPWEYLYYNEPKTRRGFFIGTHDNLILSRHVPLNPNLAKLKARDSNLRILLVISDSEDVKSEVKAIRIINTIEDLKLKLGGVIITDLLYQPTRENFKDKIKQFKPDVLHFIGHGKYNRKDGHGYLAFISKEDKKSDWVQDKDFADFFELNLTDDTKPRLIFLHACEGAYTGSYEGFKGTALQLVYSNIPAVVAMQYSVTNTTATRFAKEFYRSLSEGDPIDVAVQRGRTELIGSTSSYSEIGIPLAYLQVDESIIITSTKTETPVSNVSPKKIISEKLFPCPSREKHEGSGMVEEDDVVCIDCRHFLGKCPRCDPPSIMSLTSGVCPKCAFTLPTRKSKLPRPCLQENRDGAGEIFGSSEQQNGLTV